MDSRAEIDSEICNCRCSHSAQEDSKEEGQTGQNRDESSAPVQSGRRCHHRQASIGRARTLGAWQQSRLSVVFRAIAAFSLRGLSKRAAYNACMFPARLRLATAKDVDHWPALSYIGLMSLFILTKSL
jgi:hypothetical protein